MRNLKRTLRVLGIGAALTAALIATAAPANAAKWNQVNTTLTGTNGSVTFNNGNGYVSCQTSMTMRTSANGAYALTWPTTGGGVTFSGCYGVGSFDGLPITVTQSGAWNITPTSLTNVTAALPANSLKITAGTGVGACTITVGPGAYNWASSWSNSSHRLALGGSTSLPVSSTGGYCGSYGTVFFNMGGGWYFPTLSVI